MTCHGREEAHLDLIPSFALGADGGISTCPSVDTLTDCSPPWVSGLANLQRGFAELFEMH